MRASHSIFSHDGILFSVGQEPLSPLSKCFPPMTLRREDDEEVELDGSDMASLRRGLDALAQVPFPKERP